MGSWSRMNYLPPSSLSSALHQASTGWKPVQRKEAGLSLRWPNGSLSSSTLEVHTPLHFGLEGRCHSDGITACASMGGFTVGE